MLAAAVLGRRRRRRGGLPCGSLNFHVVILLWVDEKGKRLRVS